MAKKKTKKKPETVQSLLADIHASIDRLELINKIVMRAQQAKAKKASKR